MLRLVAPPLPGRALAVVDEAKEPARGSHGGDVTAGGCSTSSRGDAPGVPEAPSGGTQKIRTEHRPNHDPGRARSADLAFVGEYSLAAAAAGHPALTVRALYPDRARPEAWKYGWHVRAWRVAVEQRQAGRADHLRDERLPGGPLAPGDAAADRGRAGDHLARGAARADHHDGA